MDAARELMFLTLMILYAAKGASGHEVPGCPGKEARVICSSWAYKLAECEVIGAGTIIFAEVLNKQSVSDCNSKGNSPAPQNYPENHETPGIYGYQQNYLWVHSGCRAEFKVCYLECPGSLKRVICSSWNYQYAQCEVRNAGTIIYATVVNKQSVSECYPMGNSPAPKYYPENHETLGIYGYQHNYLWVHSGCRAEFEVCHLECPGKLMRVSCSSWLYQFAKCKLPVAGTIIYATVINKQSVSECISKGYSPALQNYPANHETPGIYGYQQNFIWVHSGCRAEFEVCFLDFAIPDCNGTLVLAACSSWKFKYEVCPVGDGTQVIDFAGVAKLQSISKCNFFKRNYLNNLGFVGVYGHRKNLLWVNNGCRAIFYVCLVPGCPGTLTRVSCSSWHYQYDRCRVPDAGTIIYATVYDKQSVSPCISMSNAPSPPDYPQNSESPGIFGYKYDTLWVNSGCRAEFDVCYSEPCIIKGDPHINTTDSKHYIYGGDCTYYVVYDLTSSFRIKGDFFRCRQHHPHVSCLYALIIENIGIVIKLERKDTVFIHNVLIDTFPYDNGIVKIWRLPMGFKVKLDNGVSIFWDGEKYARINFPISFQGIIRGLCGTYDFNIRNDFMLPNGTVVGDENIFGDSWVVNGTCH